MPTPTPALGFQAKFGIGTATPVTEALDIVGETLSANEEDRNLGGMRGTRSRHLRRNRLVTRAPGGDVVMEPNAVEFGRVLSRALGGTVAGTSYPLAETLPEFAAQLQDGGTLLSYTGCKCSRLEIAARGKGSNLQATMGILAKEETPTTPGTFPAISLDETTIPFIFEELILTVGGVSYDVLDFAVSIDNVVRSRHPNSITPTAIYPTDRMVRWALRLPWGDTEALYASGMGTAGVALVATFSVFNTSLVLSSPAVKFPRNRVGIQSREETMQTLQGTALYTTTPGDELAVTLDSTP